jgi:hypothetical protein
MPDLEEVKSGKVFERIRWPLAVKQLIYGSRIGVSWEVCESDKIGK